MEKAGGFFGVLFACLEIFHGLFSVEEFLLEVM